MLCSWSTARKRSYTTPLVLPAVTTMRGCIEKATYPPYQTTYLHTGIYSVRTLTCFGNRLCTKVLEGLIHIGQTIAFVLLFLLAATEEVCHFCDLRYTLLCSRDSLQHYTKRNQQVQPDSCGGRACLNRITYMYLCFVCCLPNDEICSNIWFTFVGDSAYSLEMGLIKPFPDNAHNPRRVKNFNYRLSATRCVIENANARLKNKFMRLKFIRTHSVDRAKLIIRACLILHNFIIETDTVLNRCAAARDRSLLPTARNAIGKREAISKVLAREDQLVPVLHSVFLVPNVIAYYINLDNHHST